MNLKHYLKAQCGRSMVEILGVLVVIGVLTIGGVVGYRYALDKGRANRLINDVELAYVSATSQTNRETGVLTPVEFEPSSGYPMWTELVSDEIARADIVLVKTVEESVCDIVLDMVEHTDWQVFSVDATTNYFRQLAQCEEQNALVFSLDDVSDFMYVCDKECPENMMCNINDECVCAIGYEMDETTGKCKEVECDYSGGLQAQTKQFCCEEVGGVWDEITTPPTCNCPEGYFFNGKTCAIDNWCSYIFMIPEIVQSYEADCAYEFAVPEITQSYQADCAYKFKVPNIVQSYQADCTYDFTVTDTDGTITTTMTPGTQKCGSGQYCILNWTNGGCTSGVGAYAAGTTTTIYGRCAPYEEYYNICVKKNEGEVSMEPVSDKQCGNGQYCILNWTNGGCTSGVGTYGNNTETTIYGRCTPYEEYYNICVKKTDGEVTMTPVSDKRCGSGQYCILNWTNGGCTSGVGTYGNNTKTTIYGRCAQYEEYYNICTKKTEGEVTMAQNKKCKEGQYCSISWANGGVDAGWTCSAVGTYPANSERDLFGVCLDYGSNEKMECPFK